MLKFSWQVAHRSGWSAASKRFGSSSAFRSNIPPSAPRVVQPSTWEAIIPRFLKRPDARLKRRAKKEWNPATFYIVIYLLIGSNAINLIALRNSLATFSRKADAEIAKLREVLKRVQEGEDVDVESVLGTGDEEREKEWQKIIDEFENDPSIANASEEKTAEPEQEKPESGRSENGTPEGKPSRKAAFY